MNGRDGRYDSGEDDADWLLSQLGSGRRPDLEGRVAPNPPVAPAAPYPTEPVSPPPTERPRRRTEESLDWFSLAEPADDTDAATRALPVVGEPIQRRDDAQEWAQPHDWEPQAPAWNQPPAWDDRRPPVPPRAPQHPAPPDRLTSVEPPVGAPVPPAFGGPPAPPPGPVTPTANFALTWGEQQPVESEDDLRAAFRRLAEPSSSQEPEDHRPAQYDAEPPFDGFAPPPVARQSFTPAVPPAAGQAFPPARTDFDDELWSALNEEPQQADPAPQPWQPYDDGRGYSDEQAYADASGQDDQAYGRQHHADGADQWNGYAEQGNASQGYDERGYDEQGYAVQGYPEQGYPEQGYEEQGYEDRDRDGDGHADPGFAAGAHPFAGLDRRFGDDGPDDRRFDEGGLDPRWFDGSAVDDPTVPTDDAARMFEQDDRDAVRWYADERDAGGSAATSGDGFDDGVRADDESSDMARELAQTGYFWNLTPDPTAPDPKAQDDDAPGPRRRGQVGPEAFSGRDAQVTDDGAGDRVPFDDPFRDRAPAEDSPAASEEAPEWWETSSFDGDADDPYGRGTDDDGERRSEVDDDPFGLGTTPFRDDRGYDDPRFSSGDADQVVDDPYADERFRGDAPRRDGDRSGEPGTDADGLSSLFAGAGFGLTGPTPIAGGRTAARTPADDPFGRDADDRFAAYDRDDVVGRDPFGRDADPFGRDVPGARDRYDRDDRDLRGGSSSPRPTQADDDRGGRSPVKLLAWIAGGLAAVLLVVAGVSFASQLLGGSGGEPVADEAPAAVAEPTAIQPPGVHAWNQLFGGECLEPFGGPWADEFTVVDCAAPHAAQLVLRGEVSTDEAAPFPGEAEIATQVGALCSAEGVVSPDVAAQAGDLQVAGSYPVTEEQWLDGERTYYCFVTRGSGEPITGDARGPASTQG
ncbi:MAG TPA: septum formation family protein [Agromyces sp.]